MVNKKTKAKVQPELDPVPPTSEPAISEDDTTASSATVDEKPSTKAKSSRTAKKTETPPVEAVIPPIVVEPALQKSDVESTLQKSDSKKAEKEKATKLKRLTLDIPKPLHKAIKAQAVEEGIPMVDMLRTLLEKHYSKQ